MKRGSRRKDDREEIRDQQNGDSGEGSQRKQGNQVKKGIYIQHTNGNIKYVCFIYAVSHKQRVKRSTKHKKGTEHINLHLTSDRENHD